MSQVFGGGQLQFQAFEVPFLTAQLFAAGQRFASKCSSRKHLAVVGRPRDE